MPEPVYRSRAESPVVLPFIPFTRLAELFQSTELKVATKYESVRVASGAIWRTAGDHLRTAGLQLELNCDPAELEKAIVAGGLSVDDVSFAVVLAEPKGGQLKLVEVLWSRTVAELEPQMLLQARGATRPPVLRNHERGYTVRFVAVFNGIAEPEPLKPRRPGTVLASATFKVFALGRSTGLQPHELTSEVRKEFELKPTTWLFVRRAEALHTTERLDDAVTIYVDKEILQLAAKQPTETKALAEALFAVPALVQVVAQLAMDLASDEGFEWKDQRCEALLLVREILRDSGLKLEQSDLVDLLRENPARVLAIVGGHDGQRKRILGMLEIEEQETVDVVPSS